jgi:hypothetical protein
LSIIDEVVDDVSTVNGLLGFGTGEKKKLPWNKK